MVTRLPAPALFADFTTEGTTNNYIFNGNTSASAAAWLTAINGTFTQAGTLFYTNSSGLLAQAPANTLRFDYDPVGLTSRGLLLEDSSQNILVQSNNFSDASWVVTSASLSQNAIGPDGIINSAWTITSGGVVTAVQQLASPGVVNTTSFWVKAGTGSFPFIQVNAIGFSAQYFNLTSGTVGSLQTGGPTLSNAQIFKYPNGWYRITVTADNTTTEIGIGIADADGNRSVTSGKTLLIWGAQLEPKSFPSSYIPTTTVGVSRASDALTATPISTWYGAAAGTIYVKSDTAAVTQGGMVAIDDGGANNRIDIRSQTANHFLGIISSGGGTSFNPLDTDTGQSAYTVNVPRAAAIAATANDFLYMADGGTVDTGISGAMPISPTTLRIGDAGGDGFKNSGRIAQVGYWPLFFTVSQLTGLTSGSFALLPADTPLSTVLTRTPAKAFLKRHYREELEKLRDAAVAERALLDGLDDKGRADREYESAKSEFDEYDRNLSVSNYAKAMDAKEKLSRARKDRDHHYYMDIVNKEWAKHKESKRH